MAKAKAPTQEQRIVAAMIGRREFLLFDSVVYADYTTYPKSKESVTRYERVCELLDAWERHLWCNLEY